jgi:hypothetical protein
MKKILALAILPVIVFSFTGLISCKNKSGQPGDKKIELDQIQTIKKEIKKNVYPIPSSAKVVKMLADFGVNYINTIPNPPENVRKYLTMSKKAQNLGAYGADLSYATLYDIQQDVMDYLGAIRSLSNELNIPGIYDESLYEKIKMNVDKKDSLVAILTDAFNSTYSYLSDNEQQTMGLLIVGGAWVEGMHLAVKVSGAAYNIQEMTKVLLEQKSSLMVYLDITKPHLDDPNLNEFVKMLEPIRQVYAPMTTSLTKKNIDDITSAIEGIRKQMVQ